MGNGFGKVNLDNNTGKLTYWKLREPNEKKGEVIVELVLRLLPSMHSYEDTGAWEFYYAQHFGHFGVNSNNPDKPRARPFGCIKKMGKNKVIEVACPKCEQVDKMMAKKERLEIALAAKLGIEDRKSPEFWEAKKADKELENVGGWLQRHNSDKKYWINAMDEKGNFGILQVSYTFNKDVLKPFLQQLRDKRGLDVFNPAKGAFLHFTSTGKRPRVTQNVTLYEDLVTIDGEQVSKMKPAPMTEAQMAQALKVCPDLAKDVVKFISSDTITALINSSDDPEETDRIWPQPTRAAATAKKAEVKTEADEVDDHGPDEDEVTPITATLVRAVVAKAVVPDIDEEEAELERRLAEKRAKKLAAAGAGAGVTATGNKGVVATSAEDFLSQFGDK
jgi:hypothetical protein